MYCNVCGCENGAVFRRNKGSQFLCDYCNWETPRKVNKDSFCKAFFNTESEKMNAGILKEFYDDYRTSTLNLAEYCRRCTSESF